MKTNRFYRVDAELLFEGKHCTIWVEKGFGVSEVTARAMADAYDAAGTGIREKMLDAFGLEGPFININNGTPIAADIMELADYYGDGDKKLCILLLDIKDDYRLGEHDSYVAGYFWSGNFYENIPGYLYSNECDMIYVDLDPGVPGFERANITLAHEMQHLMNWTTSQVKRRNLMDGWIDEGLSAAAEWVYAGENTDRLNWFNNDESGLIRKGNNFFVWDNHRDNQYAVLDDYATAYLFFQWLRLQSSGGIYRDIISSDNYDYQAVTKAMKRYDSDYADWGTLLKTWLAANYINAAAGPYGYKGIQDIKAKTVPAGTTSVALAPGEGVYSLTDSAGSTSVYNPAGNIRYAGLNKDSPNLSDTIVYKDGALLSYNINQNKGSRAENGSTTGIAGAEMASGGKSSRALAARPPLSGPFPIGAGDMLRRNGHENSGGSFSLPRFPGRVIAGE